MREELVFTGVTTFGDTEFATYFALHVQLSQIKCCPLRKERSEWLSHVHAQGWASQTDGKGGSSKKFAKIFIITIGCTMGNRFKLANPLIKG